MANSANMKDGAGRPPSDDPSDKTLANRASARRSAAYRIGEEAELPEWLRFDRLAEADAARIFQYAADDLRRFDSRRGRLHYADERGIWQTPALTWTAADAEDWRRFIHGGIERGRAAAILELAGDTALIADADERELYIDALASVRVTNDNHERNVAATVIDHSAGVERLGYREEYDYARNPVMPLADGGGWHVADARPIDRDELRELHIVGLRWSMPTPDMDAYPNPKNGVQWAVRRVLDERYGADFLRRVALTALGPGKRIESVKAHLPSFGKSTFWRTMQDAFGMDSVTMLGERALENIGGRFTPIHAALADTLWAVIDEVDKAGAINTAKINELIGDTLSVERKGVDPYEARRTATLWLSGNDWANIDTGAAGIPDRFGWAWDFADSIERNGVMTDADAQAMRHPDAGAVVQSRILGLAADMVKGGQADAQTPLAAAFPQTINDASRAAAADFLSAGKPLADKVLADCFASADGNAFTLSATRNGLTAKLKAAGLA